MKELLLEIRQKSETGISHPFDQWQGTICSPSILANYQAFVYDKDRDRVIMVFHGSMAGVNLTGYLLWLRETMRGRPDVMGDEAKLAGLPFALMVDIGSGNLYEGHRSGALPENRPDPFKYGHEWRKYLSTYFMVMRSEVFTGLQEAFTGQFRTASLWVTRKDSQERHRVVVIASRSFFSLPESTADTLAPDGEMEYTRISLTPYTGESDELPPRRSRMPLMIGLALLVAAVAVAAVLMTGTESEPTPPAAVVQDMKELIPEAPQAVPEPAEVAPALVPLPPVRSEIAHRDEVLKSKWKKRPKKTGTPGKTVAPQTPPAPGQATAPAAEIPAEEPPEEPAEDMAEAPQPGSGKKPLPVEVSNSQYWQKKKAIKSGKLDAETVKQEIDPYAEIGSIFMAKLKVVADNHIINKKLEALKDTPSDDPGYAVEKRRLEEEDISGVLNFQINKRPDVLKSFGAKCEVEEVSQFLFNLAYLEYTKKKYYTLGTFKTVAAAIDPSAKRAKSGKPVLDITHFVKRCVKRNSKNARRLTNILIASLYYLEHVYYSYVKTEPPPRLRQVETNVYNAIERMVLENNVEIPANYFDELVLSVVSFHQRYRAVPINEGPLLDKIRVRCWKKEEVSRYCKF